MSEGYPPALGPPPPDEPFRHFGTFILIDKVKEAVKETVDGLNAKIESDKDSTHIEAHVSFDITTFKPRMSTSQFSDRPNENVVRISFIVSYDVTGIKYRGIPYFDRKMGQSIDADVSCNNWFTDQGRLLMAAHVDKPHLEGPSFGEEALNIFVNHTLTDRVDSELRKRLPEGFSRFQNLEENEDPDWSKCNCLSVTPGTAPTYRDGDINYRKTRVRLPIPTASDGSVTFQSIKRLPARSPSGVLYDDVEDIQLALYVNHTLRTVQLQGMREGDERSLAVDPVGLPREILLVLICNVEQLSSSHKDTGFRVFTEETNFGYGTQKIVVKKTYWDPPQRLPDGSLTKPTEVHVDGYEITALIKAPQPDERFRGVFP